MLLNIYIWKQIFRMEQEVSHYIMKQIESGSMESFGSE